MNFPCLVGFPPGNKKRVKKISKKKKNLNFVPPATYEAKNTVKTNVVNKLKDFIVWDGLLLTVIVKIASDFYTFSSMRLSK